MLVELGDEFTYFNNDILEEFKDHGSQSLIQLIDASDRPENESADVLATIFTELLMIFQDDKISVESVVNFLSTCIKNEEIAISFCHILDLFPVTDQIEELMKHLYATQKVIKTSTLVKFISSETINKLGILPNDSLTRQLNVRKRDEFYTQKKFNLLHEEPEGYSRIIVEFITVLLSGESQYQVDHALFFTNSIVGHYNLDPNRVFDIIYDCFANYLISNELFIINFFKKSKWWPSIESDNSSIASLSFGGNSELAKIVGLKFLGMSKSKPLPETFKLLTSILIKEGMMSFGSLYEFFLPDATEMTNLEKAYKKNLDEEVFKSSANALALAAPLLEDDDEDDDNEAQKSTTSDKLTSSSIKHSLNSNVKYQMLRSFLSLGLYWPSVYILTEYPFLALIDSEINELICRIYHHMISPFYLACSPFNSQELEELREAKPIVISRRNNEVALENVTVQHFLTFKATVQDFSQKKFKYFYDGWTNGLPLIYNLQDLETSTALLKFLNVTFARDASLFSKICDVAWFDLNNGGSKQLWFIFIRNYIFPAISVIEANNILIEKAFRLLAMYPKLDRFTLYSEFHQVTSKNNPYIKMSYGKAEKATKDILKRLSKETVKPLMRKLAKTSFANPLPCFLTILQQIESYDNLNTLVVETARYFNSYGWDVLVLAIIMRITVTGRSNIQENGLFERQWIQSLSSFIGKICHRYPNSIDLNTLLEFLIKSLNAGDTTGLIVLKELFMSMGGLTISTNLTLQQIYKLNSGEILQKDVYQTVQDKRFDSLKSGSILVNKLIELDGVNELLILLCQINDKLTYDNEDVHLKLIANRKDDILIVIQLFCDLLNFFAKDSNKMKQYLVPVPKLCIDYLVPPEWSFAIWRKYFVTESSKDIDEILLDLRNYCDSELWNTLSQQLYGTFWQLSLYDINYVEELYTSLLTKHQDQFPRIESAYNRSKRNNSSKQTIADNLALVEETRKFLETIPEDQEKHKNHTIRVEERLKLDSTDWFKDGSVTEFKAFLQYCILPRAVTSSYDAIFSAKFIFKLDQLNVSNFNILQFLDTLIGSQLLFGTLFTSTLIESENLGLFYCELLSSMNAWKDSDKDNTTDINEKKKKIFDYHVLILGQVLKLLRTTDYMCRRNTIIFLKNIVALYPVVEDHCENLVDAIANIVDTEDREDLKLAANALIGHLKSRQSKWVHMWDYYDMDEESLIQQKNKREEISKAIESKRQAEKAEKEAKAAKERERIEKERKEKEKLENEARENERKARLLEKANKEKIYSDGGSGPRTATRERQSADKNKVDYYSKYEETSSGRHVKEDKPKQDSKNDHTRHDEDKISQLKLEKDSEVIESTKEVGGNDSKSVGSFKPPSEPRGDKRRQPLPPQLEIKKTKEPLIPPSEPKRESRTREPLPPQSNLRMDSRPKEFSKPYRRDPVSRNGGQTYDNRQQSYNRERTNYRQNHQTGQQHNSHQSVPPPPPPPPSSTPSGPQRSSYNGRQDHKRKYDYPHNSRGYDKRQKR